MTGIRHWSTADYTRVAIDLDAEVKYEAGRVPDPDRIFFDLPDTRLASTLVGKSFDVQDGFLKKIRVAQYQLGSTRVVLEVDDVTEYSAFLLPNPYRLIIDIHGRAPHPQSQVATNLPADVAPDEYTAKPGASASHSTVASEGTASTMQKAAVTPRANNTASGTANGGHGTSRNHCEAIGREASVRLRRKKPSRRPSPILRRQRAARSRQSATSHENPEVRRDHRACQQTVRDRPGRRRRSASTQ